MNDRGEQAEPKNFLSRWAQRKQEAKQESAKLRQAPGTEVAPEQAAEPEFDLSSLPKLEELTETTDITGFLQKGVPEQLRNAALRKSWALDPAIRNYVNPALDYAYDWNTPGGVPGSGEIGAGVDVARMVAQIMGGVETSAEQAAAPSPPPSAATASVGPEMRPELPAQPVRRGGRAALGAADGVTAADDTPAQADPSPAAPQQAVRRHGTAKPVI